MNNKENGLVPGKVFAAFEAINVPQVIIFSESFDQRRGEIAESHRSLILQDTGKDAGNFINYVKVLSQGVYNNKVVEFLSSGLSPQLYEIYQTDPKGVGSIIAEVLKVAKDSDISKVNIPNSFPHKLVEIARTLHTAQYSLSVKESDGDNLGKLDEDKFRKIIQSSKKVLSNGIDIGEFRKQVQKEYGFREAIRSDDSKKSSAKEQYNSMSAQPEWKGRSDDVHDISASAPKPRAKSTIAAAREEAGHIMKKTAWSADVGEASSKLTVPSKTKSAIRSDSPASNSSSSASRSDMSRGPKWSDSVTKNKEQMPFAMPGGLESPRSQSNSWAEEAKSQRSDMIEATRSDDSLEHDHSGDSKTERLKRSRGIVKTSVTL